LEGRHEVRMLVVGGTGTVGTEVVRALTNKGAKVRVMTRTLGAHSGAEYVAGSLESPETLGSAFDRVAKVYLLTPLAENEVELGMNAVRAAQESGVLHIVFHSVHRAADAPQVPHFKTKLDIIEGLRSSGIPYTVLSPNTRTTFSKTTWGYRSRSPNTACMRLPSAVSVAAAWTYATLAMRRPLPCSRTGTRDGITRSSARTF
jgi:nucleoside-diphosphate-sugar epimerase